MKINRWGGANKPKITPWHDGAMCDSGKGGNEDYASAAIRIENPTGSWIATAFACRSACEFVVHPSYDTPQAAKAPWQCYDRTFLSWHCHSLSLPFA